MLEAAGMMLVLATTVELGILTSLLLEEAVSW
jgi:hypothetical protein